MTVPLSVKPYRWTCQDLLHEFGIEQITPYTVHCEVTGITMDSRQIRPGDMFIMVQGIMTHGMRYIRDALKLGAKAILCDTNDFSSEKLETHFGKKEIHVPVFCIRNLRDKLGMLANKFYSSPSSDLSVIGVTGTNGKTSCAYFIAQLYMSMKKRCGISGTLGAGVYPDLEDTGLTTPDVISVHRNLAWLRDQGIRHVVMEVSSHALDQGRVQGVTFETVLFTNLSHDHQDYHVSMEEYFQTKSRLFHECSAKRWIVNVDDIYGRRLYKDLHGRALSFSSKCSDIDNDIRVDLCTKRIMSSLSGDHFEFRYQGSTKTAKSSLIGYASMSNASGSLLALIAAGFPFDNLVENISCLQSPPGRLERVNHEIDNSVPTVFIDFAHTPDALHTVLEDLRPVCKGKLWCVFGCGGERDRKKRPIMGSVAEKYADRMVITSDNPRGEDPEGIIKEILQGVSSRRSCHVISDRSEAIRFAITHAHNEDIILIAGKGHEQYQIVKDGRRIPLNEGQIVKNALSERE